jgi:L-threonylcarbamoyladenylate synthase
MFFKKNAKIIKIDKNHPDEKIVNEASIVLKKGGLIVYPTDTAYGIGVNAFDLKAIKKLYDIKGRDSHKPTHVVVRDWNMTEEITVANRAARILFDNFMPGQITLILPKKDNVSNELTGSLDTLGVRIPNLRLTTMLSNSFDTPYTTPSANRSGEKNTIFYRRS